MHTERTNEKMVMRICGFAYAIILCICIMLFICFSQINIVGIWLQAVKWWSVLTCILTVVMAIFYGHYRAIRYPETLKLICTAALVIWYIFPALWLGVPWMMLINAIFSVSLISMAILYFIKRRKEKGKKGGMVACLIFGIPSSIFTIVSLAFLLWKALL